MEFPVTVNIPELRPTSTTLQGIVDEILENITATADTLLDADELSQVQGPAPVQDPTQPFGVRVQQVLLSGSPTADRNHIFQNKAGVVALLNDAYGIASTTVLPEGIIHLDWALGKKFVCTLSGNRKSVVYMSHSQAGMEVDLLLVNNGTHQTINTWDASIKWPSGVSPTMPPATAGGAALQRVNLVNVNGTIYGESKDYSGPPVIVPVLTSNTPTSHSP